MPKYLYQASYTDEGATGLLSEGGSSRRQVFADLAAEQGGSLEAFYYAFGSSDLYMIVDLPDAVSAAAISLAVGARGAIRISTVPLLTVEDIDAAIGKTVSYRAPGD